MVKKKERKKERKNFTCTGVSEVMVTEPGLKAIGLNPGVKMEEARDAAPPGRVATV